MLVNGNVGFPLNIRFSGDDDVLMMMIMMAVIVVMTLVMGWVERKAVAAVFVHFELAMTRIVSEVTL